MLCCENMDKYYHKTLQKTIDKYELAIEGKYKNIIEQNTKMLLRAKSIC